MMIRTTMALRNTIRQPRRTILLGGAIALGVTILGLASGFTAGMEAAIQDNVTLLSAGHVLVNGVELSESGRAQNRISDATLGEKVTNILPDAISISKTAQAQATVVFGSREQQLRLRGVAWDEDKLFSSSLILVEGSWEAATKDRMIVLGAQSARRFGLGLGDSVFVRISTVSGQQNVTEYALGAVYDDSAAGGMTTALVPLPNLLADLNMKESQYQSLSVFLGDASLSESTADKLAAGLKSAGINVMSTPSQATATRQPIAGSVAAGPEGGVTPGSGPGMGRGMGLMGGAGAAGGVPGGTPGGAAGTALTGRPFGAQVAGSTVYRITTITQLSGQMGAVLGSVRWIGITIFMIMLVLTAAGIANTYRMVLMERTREIGMLRCIGFKRKDVFRIFLYEAGLIALAGSLAGIVVSLPIGLLIHLIRFDPSGSLGSALSRGHLLFEPNILSYILISLAVIFASVLAVVGPARRASRLQPVEALRTKA